MGPAIYRGNAVQALRSLVHTVLTTYRALLFAVYSQGTDIVHSDLLRSRTDSVLDHLTHSSPAYP